MNKTTQAIKYIVLDFLAAASAWALFYVFRKLYLEPLKFGYSVGLQFEDSFFYALLLIPLAWISFYGLVGFYRNSYRKSRLKEIGQTLLQTIIGVVVIFFALLLDDQIADYNSYYLLITSLFLLHFSITFLFRTTLTTLTTRKIHRRKIGFNTLIIGSNEKAVNLFKELSSQSISSGFKLKGYVHVNGGDGSMMKQYLPHLGHIDNLVKVIEKEDVEEVILAVESGEHDNIKNIMNKLQGRDVYIKVIPDMYDIMSGSVKMTSIFGAPLIDINNETMPQWQQAVKRIMDITVSLIVLIVGFPFYLIVGILVLFSSKGPVFYYHERIGKNGKPFVIYKFRSMYVGAEEGTPLLSSDNDTRITPFGRIMRKTRIDEFPQFYNVLKGDMSMVGPRPERQFFIDKIKEKAPHYDHLNKVKPGITSWGQVKYGYAENVEEMIERLKYDVLYVKNRSLYLDFKILIYTVLIVLQGRGK